MSKKLLDLDGLRYFYGKILARMGNLSNPALNENPDFQIWQRGTSFTKPGYTADRWKFNHSTSNGSRIDKVDNGLKITWLSNCTTSIEYFMENKQNILNKKITISITLDNVVKTFTTTLESMKDCILYNGVFSKLTDSVDSYKVLYCNFTKNANATMVINWVKLELGEIATPLSPRSYGEELALCQRYCRPLKGRYPFSAYATNAIYFCSLELLNMRVSPTLVGAPVGGVDFDVINVQHAAVSGFAFSIDQHSLITNKTAHGLTMAGLIVYKPILLDSEIY